MKQLLSCIPEVSSWSCSGDRDTINQWKHLKSTWISVTKCGVDVFKWGKKRQKKNSKRLVVAIWTLLAVSGAALIAFYCDKLLPIIWPNITDTQSPGGQAIFRVIMFSLISTLTGEMGHLEFFSVFNRALWALKTPQLSGDIAGNRSKYCSCWYKSNAGSITFTGCFN